MSDDDPFGTVTEDELDAARVQIRDNAPDTIHLQWDGDCDVTMVYGEPYADEVTWSIERIWDGDIEYVRASRYREAVELLRSEPMHSQDDKWCEWDNKRNAFLAGEAE